MIKSDYKPGDKIESIKPGILNGLQGDVLSNSPEKERQQLSVICGAFGSWNFSYNEVKPIGQVNTPSKKESPAEPLKKAIIDKLPFEIDEKPEKPKKLKMQTVGRSTVIKEVGAKNSIENLEVATGKQKMVYNKRLKNEPIKEKRKYQKKAK